MYNVVMSWHDKQHQKEENWVTPQKSSEIYMLCFFILKEIINRQGLMGRVFQRVGFED